MAALVASALVVMLVQETGTAPSTSYASFVSPETVAGAPEPGLKHQMNPFFNGLKARYPSSFTLDAAGKAHITIATQSFYTCAPNGNQEVSTAKSGTKERIVFELNQKGISYNLQEGLGMWTIQWNEQLFLPAL